MKMDMFSNVTTELDKMFADTDKELYPEEYEPNLTNLAKLETSLDERVDELNNYAEQKEVKELPEPTTVPFKCNPRDTLLAVMADGNCDNCRRLVSSKWLICPYCMGDLKYKRK